MYKRQLQPHLKKEIPALCTSKNFDFLIGSTHLADRMDPYEAVFFDNRTEKQAYQNYFEVLLKNLQTYSCFDTCGHIDYVVRYGPFKNTHYCYKNHADTLDEILKTLIHNAVSYTHLDVYKRQINHCPRIKSVLIINSQ